MSSAKSLIKRKGVQQLPSTQQYIAEFEVTILSGRKFPSSSNGKQVYISWRRGSKKKNTGKTSKTLCQNGEAEWVDLNEEPIKLHCTLFKESKNKFFQQKTLALSVKKVSGDKKQSSIGHVILDLADFAADGTDITKYYPLTTRSSNQSHISSNQTNYVSNNKYSYSTSSVASATVSAAAKKSFTPENNNAPEIEIHISTTWFLFFFLLSSFFRFSVHYGLLGSYSSLPSSFFFFSGWGAEGSMGAPISFYFLNVANN